jgi:2-polyprenyl-3-methyl-5-hydroxy-6-metoxy-1,4-benzoquinol methylase
MSQTQSTTMTDLAGPRPRDGRLRLALRLAKMIRTGTLTVVLPDGSSHRVVKSPEPSATIVIKDPRAVTRLVTGGSLGLAEAYLDGLWDSPEIRGVMAVAAANEAEWLEMLKGRPWVRAASKLLHKLRPNTRKGAKRNIAEHYDLGNDFYEAWLDPSMTYSSALFAGSQETMEGGQLRKIRRLCDVLGLKPGMTVLEIGCGWGSFAELAAREYGVSVVGITLSPAQLAYAKARIAGTEIEGRVEFRLEDYRDVRGHFDRIVSVEMFGAGWSGCRPSPSRTACSPIITRRPISFSGTSSRAGCCRARRCCAPRRRRPGCNGWKRIGSAPTTPRRWRAGRWRFRRPGPTSPGCGRTTTPASSGCGNTTCPIARLASAPAGQMSARCYWRGLPERVASGVGSGGGVRPPQAPRCRPDPSRIRSGRGG